MTPEQAQAIRARNEQRKALGGDCCNEYQGCFQRYGDATDDVDDLLAEVATLAKLAVECCGCGCCCGGEDDPDHAYAKALLARPGIGQIDIA